MTKKKVKKIKVLSYAKLQTIIMAYAGLATGILYSFGGFAIDSFVSAGWLSPASASTPGLSYGTILAFGALIGMPIYFATIGFIMGIIGATMYNLTSKYFLKIDKNINY